MKKRIIVAEDDKIFALAMVAYFNQKGYDVISLSSIKELIEYIDSNSNYRQVFILDRQLKDGISESIFEKISSLPSSRFLILTAYPTFESSIIALRTKARDYLTKPTSLHVLEGNVSSIFDELEKASSESIEYDQRWDALIKSHFTRSDTVLIALHRCIEIGITPSTTNIATMINLSMSTVHRGAKDLFNIGLVHCEIDSSDKRVKVYTLTNSGQERINLLINKIKKGIR